MALVRWDQLKQLEEMNERLSRACGSFVRTFVVPDNIDEAKVSAEFKDGVLNVHLPKTEKAKHRAIEVKVG